MKKYLSILLVLLSLVSCGPSYTSSYESDESRYIDTLNIEKFALNFLESHPNLSNNSITRKEAAKEFKKQFVESVDEKELLKGVPMSLRSLKEGRNGKYIAHFWSVDKNRDLIMPFEDVCFDIAVSIPKDVAIELVENSKYLLDVTYVSHFTSIAAFQYMIGYRDWVHVESVELEPIKDSYTGSGKYHIYLGMMLVDFKSIKPYPDSY